jgi:PleD family two-component response regulator
VNVQMCWLVDHGFGRIFISCVSGFCIILTLLVLNLGYKENALLHLFLAQKPLAKNSRKNSPIVIVDDDEDDIEILVNVFKEIGVTNELRCFSHPATAIEYLRSTKEVPFLIICDINLPSMTGLAFKSN